MDVGQTHPDYLLLKVLISNFNIFDTKHGYIWRLANNNIFQEWGQGWVWLSLF